jgi:hypothetical protein
VALAAVRSEDVLGRGAGELFGRALIGGVVSRLLRLNRVATDVFVRQVATREQRVVFARFGAGALDRRLNGRARVVVAVATAVAAAREASTATLKPMLNALKVMSLFPWFFTESSRSFVLRISIDSTIQLIQSMLRPLIRHRILPEVEEGFWPEVRR